MIFKIYSNHPLPSHIAISNNLREDLVAMLQFRCHIFFPIHISEQQSITGTDNTGPSGFFYALKILIVETPPLSRSQMVLKADLFGTEAKIPVAFFADAVVPSDTDGGSTIVFYLYRGLLSLGVLRTRCFCVLNLLTHCFELLHRLRLKTGDGPLGVSRYAPEYPGHWRQEKAILRISSCDGSKAEEHEAHSKEGFFDQN